MRRYLIETSVIVGYLRDKRNAKDIIENLKGELTSSYVCLAELYEGINRVKDKKLAEQGVLDFFKGLSEVFGIDLEISRNFGKLRADLKEKGEVIEDLDIILSATCLANNLTLVTFNSKHFGRIKGLEILD